MNRSKAGARLSAYLEGDLSAAERSKLESHLAKDPALRETLRELEGVVGLLRNVPEPELPPAFSTRVIARVQEQREQASGGVLGWVRRLFEPVVAVPLAAGITALALVIGSQQGIDSPPGELDGELLQAAAVAEPAPKAARPAAPPPTDLASAPREIDDPTFSGIQRRSMQTTMARRWPEDLPGMLRGSAHPFSESIARQVEDGPTLMFVSHETRRGRARR